MVNFIFFSFFERFLDPVFRTNAKSLGKFFLSQDTIMEIFEDYGNKLSIKTE